MKILALDIGKFNTMCCLFDTQTRKAEFQLGQTSREYMGKLLKWYGADLVAMEACGPSGWLHDLCRELKLKTIVCSTNEEAWKWSNVKRKTDRDDALKLAKLAAMQELKGVHVPEPEQRQFRTLVKYRKTLDQRINRIKNTIRSLFVNQGIEIERGSQAWTSKGLAHIKSYRKALEECSASDFWKGELNSELTQLEALGLQMDEVEKQLDQLAEKDPRIIRLMTIPGVGRKTAEALVSAIDDPHRFQSARQVSAYFGLVPKQFQSGEMNRHGRITKRGSVLVRSMLVECAWCALRYNEWAKQVYDRICGKQKTRKKKAAIALARKIAVVAWAMLRDEADWDLSRMDINQAAHTRQRKRSAASDSVAPEQPLDEPSKAESVQGESVQAGSAPTESSTGSAAKEVSRSRKSRKAASGSAGSASKSVAHSQPRRSSDTDKRADANNRTDTGKRTNTNQRLSKGKPAASTTKPRRPSPSIKKRATPAETPQSGGVPTRPRATRQAVLK